MLDVRNLVFPMTAGDLVQSAKVLFQQQRGDGPDMRLCEVVHIGTTGTLGTVYTFKDTATLEEFSISLKADTPLLITDISRS